MDMLKIKSFILGIILSIGQVFSYDVVLNLSHNGPVVSGANITFTADLVDSFNQVPVGTFVYDWRDNASPQHSKPMMITTNTTVHWMISYPSKMYSAQEYEVTLKVSEKKLFFLMPIAQQKIKFNVTEILNGNIEVEQENRQDTSVFVSNTSPVKHSIKLSQADHDFIANHATSILTFWFVDCVYYGFSTDYTFSFNYTEEKIYSVEALVMASFDEPPTTTTVATTTTPATTAATPVANTSTTSKPSVSSPTTSTTPTKTTSTGIAVNDTLKSGISYAHAESVSTMQVSTTPNTLLNFDVNNESNSLQQERLLSVKEHSVTEGTLLRVLRGVAHNGTTFLQNARSISSSFSTTTDSPIIHDILSYACLNSTFVPPDPNKTYGYFHKHIAAKAPISKVVVKGNNWLQFGDVLNLNITCNGSGKFQHCSKIKIGSHNITGNETCSSPLEGDVCDFTLTHFFREANTYTYIIIIMNDVSKVVTPAVINMYKVTVQPQLSVIVVPVTCSLLAVIIIVFGVAYYVQSQNRYTVEVADFDFGQANDMEYKSFYERLREDISNMFSRSGDFVDQADVMPRRSKYDNMEES